MIKVIKKEAKIAGKCCECDRGRIVYEIAIGSGAVVPGLSLCNKCRKELIRKLRHIEGVRTEEEELEERFMQI